MMKLKLHWQILIGLVAGVIFGILLPQYSEYVAWLGDMFLRALKMVIIPLILSSIISGVTNIGNVKNLGRLGLKTMGYYVLTSTFAILIGLFFVNLIKPGIGADLGLQKKVEGLEAASQSLGDTLLNIIPTNIFNSFANGDMLSIIFFAILFGFFITMVPEKPKTFLTDFFNSVFDVMMKITMFIIKFSPIGIFGIVAKVVGEQAGSSEALASMGGTMLTYSVTVLLGLFFHSFVTLPVILYFLGKGSFIKHGDAMSTPLLTAFSTSSSNATLPLTMEAVENNVGVSNKVTSFTLPLGATVNMDGTALYECVAAMFIAQAYGVELGLVEQFMVVVTALLASIGAAGIPMAGLVMISVILSVVGLPLEGIGLILAVDRPLDMFRTTVNVWSDSIGAAVVAKTEGEFLKI